MSNECDVENCDELRDPDTSRVSADQNVCASCADEMPEYTVCTMGDEYYGTLTMKIGYANAHFHETANHATYAEAESIVRSWSLALYGVEPVEAE